MAGLPCAVKDNMSVIGAKLTCGSRILKGYVAPYDATAVRRLRNQGATITGKTNLDESPWGLPPRPRLLALPAIHGIWIGAGRVKRRFGSRSRRRMVPVALGSDTEAPSDKSAAFTGICGLKPTYGLVSRYGAQGFVRPWIPLVPLEPTFGIVLWCWKLFAGPDINDSRTTRRERIPTPRVGKPIKGLRAGVPKEFVSEGIDSGVMATFNEAIALLSELGVVVEEISIPSIQHARDMYRVLSSCEAASTLARFDGVRYGFRAPSIGMSDMYLETRTQGFGQEAKRRIMLGTVPYRPDVTTSTTLRRPDSGLLSSVTSKRPWALRRSTNAVCLYGCLQKRTVSRLVGIVFGRDPYVPRQLGGYSSAVCTYGFRA